MKMTPAVLIIGGLLVFWASVFIIVFLPAITMRGTEYDRPSEQWLPLTEAEQVGHRLYVENGCSYCHSMYVRVSDWGHGAVRIAKPGDYHDYVPAILGTERTGPDLSQEGGLRPDDWHIAHFVNPRFTRPVSLMPSWQFLGPEKVNGLIAYMQGQGGKNAAVRVARQEKYKKEAIAAYEAGPDRNIDWLHSHVPEVWRAMPNPYPADAEALTRGKKIYQQFCINCHGPVGDGQGPAARRIPGWHNDRPLLYPPPLNFTTLRNKLWQGKYIGGIFYYQIMNGITGTAMQYFKKELESAKIWDVGNYVAVQFVGYTDADIAPEGVDAALEPEWHNPYELPTTQGE